MYWVASRIASSHCTWVLCYLVRDLVKGVIYVRYESFQKREVFSQVFFFGGVLCSVLFFGMKVAEFGLPLSCVLRFGFEQW